MRGGTDTRRKYDLKSKLNLLKKYENEKRKTKDKKVRTDKMKKCMKNELNMYDKNENGK